MHPLRFAPLWLGVWLMALAATLVICLLPMPTLGVRVEHADKLVHAFGHGALAAYAAMLFARGRALLAALAGLLLFGLVIELLQSLLPWRSGDPADLLANGLGVAAGASAALTPLARGLLVLERWLSGARWRG